MPSNVYQPNSTQSPSSKKLNPYQAYIDTLGLYRCHPKIFVVSSTRSTTSRTLTSQGPANVRLETPMAAARICKERDISCFTTIPHSPSVRNHPTPRGGRQAAILEARATGIPTNTLSTVHAPIATAVAAMVGCTATATSKPSP